MGNVVKKHSNQTDNAMFAKQTMAEVNAIQKELNDLRNQDAIRNKYKEDMKFHNFKKHVVEKQAYQSQRVLERNMLRKNLQHMRVEA